MNPGFYKNDGGILLYGPNFVLNKDYELRAETHADHTYPIDGWSWFDGEDNARVALGLPVENGSIIDEASESGRQGNTPEPWEPSTTPEP